MVYPILPANHQAKANNRINQQLTRTIQMNKPTLERCLRLFQCGYSLITVGSNKRPNYAWKKAQSGPISTDEFKTRYNYAGGVIKSDGEEMEPTEGVGIVTGYNGLEVIDVDLKVFSSLPEQQEFWAELLQTITDNIDDFDKKFVIYKTKNQGYHILYRCSINAGNTKIAKLKGQTEAVIESRGIGGYVFIYDNQISPLGYNDVKTITEKDRQILWDICRLYNYIDESKPMEAEKKIATYSGSAITPWEDYNQQVSIFDIIGPDFEIVKKLSDKYIIRRYGATSPHSGYVYTNSGCMYLFSTGTIYPNEKLISPFAAYAIKYHNADFTKAAKEAYNNGYGTRIAEKKAPVLSEHIEAIPEDAQFPIDVFPPEIQEYMIQCNKYLHHSFDYMGSSLLWLMSVIIGNTMRIEVKKGWHEISTVWISIIGPPGIGKTPSIDAMIFPLLQKNSREIKKYIQQMDRWNVYSKLSKEEKQNHEEVTEPKKSQFIANDITLEALVDLHEESKLSVGVFKDELNGWFKDMNKYRAGSDLEFWLSTWSGKSVAFNRKMSKSTFVDKPIIPVLGGIQPGILHTMYTEENKENGFVDRMLLTFPELVVNSYNEADISQDVQQWYSDTIQGLFEFVRAEFLAFNQHEPDEVDPYIAILSQPAKKEWVRMFNEITELQNSDNENEYTKSMLPKQKSYIPRFAMLIHFLNTYFNYNDKIEFLEISKESILNAEKISKYFIAMAKKIRIESRNTRELKDLAVKHKDKSQKEKFFEMYVKNPNLNRKQAADLLEVTRQTINRWIGEMV